MGAYKDTQTHRHNQSLSGSKRQRNSSAHLCISTGILEAPNVTGKGVCWGGGPGGLGAFKHGCLRMRRNQHERGDSKESLFPTPKGVQAALISTHHLPFKAPGRRELSVNSYPAKGPWALPEGTPLCLFLKGTFRTKV